MRRLLRCAWGLLSPEAMPITAKNEYGKPYFQTREGCFFSLSHTDTHVMCVLGGVPVGVDVQTVRPVRRGVAQRVCTPAELAAWDFFPLWCLKESYIKLRGRPLPWREMTFLPGPDGAIRAPAPDVTALTFQAIPGCAAAVCFIGAEAVTLREIPREMLDAEQPPGGVPENR